MQTQAMDGEEQQTVSAADAEDEMGGGDPRYASSRAVCMALHKTLLLAPVLGLGCKLGRHCVPVMEIANPVPCGCTGAAVTGEGELFTWKALNSIFVTIFKQSQDSTAIYVHPSDMHYIASPLGCLGPGCPVGTALLAQVVLDRHRQEEERYGWGLSVLIFDAVQIGREDFVQMQLPPAERYSRLMHLCSSSRDVLVSPIMRVQWAGHYAALKKFCTGPGSEKNLEHLTDSFFKYTREHPCKIVVTD